MLHEPVRRTIDLLRTGELTTRYGKLVLQARHPAGGLVILNYTHECQYSGAWDDVTMVCRGLIVDTRDWTVAAWPFPKFFNINERPETQLAALPVEPFSAYEKVDGSLGVLYRRDGRLLMASRGSFTSEQAVRGTELLRQLPHLDEIPDELTLLFEIIYPENKSIIRYDFAGLIVLAGYNRVTGEELTWPQVENWATRLGCRTPKVHSFSTVSEAAATLAHLPADVEGYVVRFASGLRVKLKGDAYLTLHRLVWGLSENRVLDALTEGTYEAILRDVPEEFRPDLEKMAEHFRTQAAACETEARSFFAQAPQGVDRKTFALWVQAHVPPAVRGAMFQLLDGKMMNWFKMMQRG